MTTHSKPTALAPDFDFQKIIPEWRTNPTRTEITREFIFANFDHAFDFMTLCAQYAKEIDHHPDWSNTWNKVNVRLSTHSEKALTQLDVLMAQAMNRFYQPHLK